MDKNPIRSLDLESFSSAGSIRHVSCRYCRLQQVQLQTGGEQLEHLDLSHNLLTTLLTTPASMTTVKTLNLNNNALQKLPQELFTSFPQLKYLFVAHNKLDSINPDTFACATSQLFKGNACGNLETVVLRNNRISSISPNAFNELKSLNALDVSQNRISHVPDNSFKHLDNLEHLDLSHNFIRDLAQGVFSKLKNLKYLYLNHNDLKVLPAELPMMEWLDISHNNIASIPESYKSTIYPIEVLNIAKNPLNCDCSLLWLKELYNERKFLAKHIDTEFQPQCSKPSTLAGERWDDITDDLFMCNAESSPELEPEEPFVPESLSIAKSSVDIRSVGLKWAYIGPISFSSVFIQYYQFGLQADTMKYVEISAYQREFLVRGLKAESGYRLCLVPRLNSKDEGDKVVPLSYSHCIEATTLEEEEAPEQPSRLKIAMYYILASIGTVLFVLVAIAVIACLAGLCAFYHDYNEKSETVTLDRPVSAKHNKPLVISEAPKEKRKQHWKGESIFCI